MNSNWELTQEKFLSAQELARLLIKADELMSLGQAKKRLSFVRDAFLIKTAIYTGLRRAEICDLQVSDLRIGNGQSFLIVKNGKGGKVRRVHFGNDYKRFLKEYLRWKAEHDAGGLTPDAYLLRTKRSPKYSVSGLWARWRKYCEKPLHSARHSFGTYGYQATRDLRLLQKQMGHAKIHTTTLYSDCTPEMILEGTQKTEALFRAVMKSAS